MMKRRTTLHALVLLVPIAALLLPNPGSGYGLTGMRQSVARMRSLEQQTVAHLLAIREDGTVLVRDLTVDQIWTFELLADTPIKAQAQREFEGRRNLTIDDLEPGRLLRITLTYPFGKIQRIRVLRRGFVPPTHFAPEPLEELSLPESWTENASQGSAALASRCR